MKRNIIYIILINIVFFGFVSGVDAALDVRISSDSPTRLAPGEKFIISISYVDLNNRGNLTNLDFDITNQNASCTVISGSCNQNNHCSFTNVKKGSTLVQLSCVKGNSNESFIVRNVVGKNSGGSINLRLASLSISTITTSTTTSVEMTSEITNPTTKKTTKKTTTTTTTTETTTEPTTTPSLPDFSNEKGELKLKNLKVIGYDIHFDKDVLEYTIEVLDDVQELDIVATPLSNDIVVENTGKIKIEDKDVVEINLLRGEEKLTYFLKIKREKARKINFLLYVVVILAILVMSGLIVMQLINRHNLRKEELEFFKENDYGKEDAKILLEEEEEFTKTFFDLNKR